MRARMIRAIEHGFNRFLTSDNRVLRAGDRLFEKALGRPRLPQLAPAGGPQVPSFMLFKHDSRDRAGAALDVVRGRKDSYTIKRRFAEGGMSSIFLVEDERGNQHLLKRIMDLSEFTPQLRQEILQRFSREIAIMARINSPNVVRLIDRDPEFPARFFVMEYVRGTDLYHLAKPGQRVKPRVAITVVIEVLKGLMAFEQALREEGELPAAVHRDIKEENILLEVRDKSIKRVLVSDFGIAKAPRSELTHTTEFMGTMARVAPEVITGGAKNVGQSADIYSLGTLLFWLLSGENPYDADSPSGLSDFAADPAEVIARARYKKPLEVPMGLWNIVFRAMAADPKKRYQDYQGFRTALSLALKEGQQIG